MWRALACRLPVLLTPSLVVLPAQPHNNTYIKLMRARLDAQGLAQVGGTVALPSTLAGLPSEFDTCYARVCDCRLPPRVHLRLPSHHQIGLAAADQCCGSNWNVRGCSGVPVL